MLTFNQVIKASALIDKLDIEIKNPEESEEKVAADLIMQVAKGLHKAEAEAKAFVISIKKCTEEEAADVDIIQLVKDKLTDAGAMNFFKSAVKSKLQG